VANDPVVSRTNAPLLKLIAPLSQQASGTGRTGLDRGAQRRKTLVEYHRPRARHSLGGCTEREQNAGKNKNGIAAVSSRPAVSCAIRVSLGRAPCIAGPLTLPIILSSLTAVLNQSGAHPGPNPPSMLAGK
jgi:hypothetical protein